MTIDRLTTDDLDYIQRTGFDPPPFSVGAAVTEAPIALRRLMRVEGVGRLDKYRGATGIAAKTKGLVTTDLLVGLYNYKVPLAFLVKAVPGRTSVSIGTWLPGTGGGDPSTVEQNALLVDSALQTLYPAVDTVDDQPITGDWPLGGLVLGIPTAKPPDAHDGALAYDRLLRALAGVSWATLVLAQPVEESAMRDLRLRLINEIRSVQTASKQEGVPSPLTDHYVQLLEHKLDGFTDGQGSGAWRTAVYLLGDAISYHRVTSLWRGVFSGEHSLPEPVRVWDLNEVPMLAASWAMLDPVDANAAPGHYRHPFGHQTLLTSSQLGAYVHFPNLETSGFAVTQVPDFDVVAPVLQDDAVTLGHVVERQRVSTSVYGLPPHKLTRHAFITGVTGSGKTNTLFHLLRQLAERAVPFLVIEPAKTEYRVLLRDRPLGEQLQVFTLGDETTSPFRLNPFEVPEGIPVAVHLDLLRSVFNVSFGMWTPLPQVLETALHAVYADRGWDITSDSNRRLDEHSERAQAFPTLTQLVRKVEEIVPQLGYEPKVTDDIQAALRTRLNSLRTGGKGRMLDVRRGQLIDTLLGRPTVLELEGMGDDEDKAFMMGLLMIRLAEHRRTHGDIDDLRHLLVIEEAHRLLANPQGPRLDEAQADIRGKAVETFTNLLSEVRAYGQGVVVADQVPAKLAPDVLKNSNLKLAHRIVAGDDRQALGTAMVMTELQTMSLATLPVGRAAVFVDGEDAPLLLQVPRAKGGSATWPGTDEVREHMARYSPDLGAGSRLPTSDCDERCAETLGACEVARRLVEDPRVMRALGRVVLSAVQTPGGLGRTWPDVVATAAPQGPPWIDLESLLNCLILHGAQALADKRGAAGGWTYAQTAAVADLIDTVLLTHFQGEDASDGVTELRVALLALQGGSFGPFQGCPDIWADSTGPCLCRYPVAEPVAEGAFAEAWTAARDEDRASEEGTRAAVWDLSQDAAYQLVEFPVEGQEPELVEELEAVARRTGLCFAQQMLAAEDWAHAATQRRALDELLVESGHRPEPVEADIDPEVVTSEEEPNHGQAT